VDEIYAGHIAEHVVDVEAAFSRWREILKPGGVVTVTVPDCEGAGKLWRERAQFPVIDVDANVGLAAVATGYLSREAAAADVDPVRLSSHRRVFDRSTLKLCLKACGFVNVREVDSHPVMVAPCCKLGWQMAIEATAPDVLC
jgi:hypothetical protein